jgi:hypothetical protein
MANAIGLRRIIKSSRLAIVDGFREGAVQECIFHIKLVYRPGAGDNQREHGVERGWLDYRAENLIVVDIRSLGEAAKDLASLVPFQRAIRVELVLENPCVGDDVGANRTRDKIPDVVSNQGSKLFFHGAVPVWIDEGGTNGGGHRR